MAMRRNRRRLRFESWLLLATRCALLALAGLALARPIGCADNALAGIAGREGGLSVFVIDDSASMAYRQTRDDSATHFEHAKKLAARLVGRLGDGSEQVAVVSASSPSKSVIAAPTFDLPAATSAINAMPQTMRGARRKVGAHLSHALADARVELHNGAKHLGLGVLGIVEQGKHLGGQRRQIAALGIDERHLQLHPQRRLRAAGKVDARVGPGAAVGAELGHRHVGTARQGVAIALAGHVWVGRDHG